MDEGAKLGSGEGMSDFNSDGAPLRLVLGNEERRWLGITDVSVYIRTVGDSLGIVDGDAESSAMGVLVGKNIGNLDETWLGLPEGAFEGSTAGCSVFLVGPNEGKIELCPEGDSLGVSDEAMLGTVLDTKEGARLEGIDGR